MTGYEFAAVLTGAGVILAGLLCLIAVPRRTPEPELPLRPRSASSRIALAPLPARRACKAGR